MTSPSTPSLPTPGPAEYAAAEIESLLVGIPDAEKIAHLVVSVFDVRWQREGDGRRLVLTGRRESDPDRITHDPTGLVFRIPGSPR